MRKHRGGAVLIFLIATYMLTSFLGCYDGFVGYRVFADESVGLGEVGVDVFVVALDGVGGVGVGNVSSTVEGFSRASQIDVIYSRLWTFELAVSYINVTMTATVIRDWTAYREAVETCSNGIIVNAHGETVPIPSGYSKEEWVDKIAEAMLTRNVTWVHTAGYPFYHYAHEDGGEGEWAEGGFKRLMSHINMGDVTCHYDSQELEPTGRITQVATSNLGQPWPDLTSHAFMVQRGRPLKASDFKNYTMLTIWGSEDSNMTGAVIRYSESLGADSFGFYVHIGTWETYDTDSPPRKTGGDYWRGFAGAAAAIWACSGRFVAEGAISGAEAAIAKAEIEGRTKGLDDAVKLSENAKEIFTKGQGEYIGFPLKNFYSAPYTADNCWMTVILRANLAADIADAAEEPSWVENNMPYLAVLGIISIGGTTTVVTGLIIKRRRNLRNSKE